MKNANEKREELLEAIATKIEFDATYKFMKENDDKEGIENLRLEVRAFLDNIEKISNEDRGFGYVYELMSAAAKQGNERVDICEPIHSVTESEVIGYFREYGIEEFTFSSGWSSSVDAAWEFVKAGAVVVGMTEINSRYEAFMSDEFEKVPAYIFKIK